MFVDDDLPPPEPRPDPLASIRDASVPEGGGGTTTTISFPVGLSRTSAGDVTIADVKFGSRARKLGVERGFKIVELKLPNPARPSQNWVFIPAALVAGLVWFLQGLRMRKKHVLSKA